MIIRGKLQRKNKIILALSLITVGIFLSTVLLWCQDSRDNLTLRDNSLWICSEGDYHVVDNEFHLEGAMATAFYKYGIGKNDGVTFEGEFDLPSEDAWVALKLRNTNPEEQLWDNNSGYFFLIRQNRVSVGKISNGGITAELYTKEFDVMNGQRYEVTVSVVNDKLTMTPKLKLFINGNVLIEYEDVEATELLKNTTSYFSVSTFEQGAIKMYLSHMGTYGAGEIIHRERQGLENMKLLQPDERWQINVPMDNDVYKYYDTKFVSGKEIIFDGIGSVTTDNIYQITSLDYSLSINRKNVNENSQTIVWFVKPNRSDYLADGSYGLATYSNGEIGIVTVNNNKLVKLPSIRTGIDFTDATEVGIDIEAKNNQSMVYVYLNNSRKAYKFKLDENIEVKDLNFIGITQDDIYNEAYITHLSYVGTYKKYDDLSEFHNVYLLDYFEEEDHNLLHWEYRQDEPANYKVVIHDSDGHYVGQVFYPKNYFTLPKKHESDAYVLYAETIDGQRASTATIKAEADTVVNNPVISQIKIRSNDITGAEFYDEATGEALILSGVNYVSLRFGDHATFEPSNLYLPANYDPYSCETMLELLKASGMNMVRVFIDSGRTKYNQGVGNQISLGYTANDVEVANELSNDYMSNVVDFITRAKNHQIYVLVNFGENELPNNQYFQEKYPLISEQDVLFTENGLLGKLEYTKLFLSYIEEIDPSLLKTILAIEAQNEFTIYTNQAPYNKIEGTYEFYGNSEVYNMSRGLERRRLANDAMKHYYSALKSTIDDINPGLLLCEGTCTVGFTGRALHEDKGLFPNDYAYTTMDTEEFLATEIDFLDIHCYEYLDSDFDGYYSIERDLSGMNMNDSKVVDLRKDKPIILGEFAANKSYIPSMEEGATYLIDGRDAALDMGVKGTMLWTFDTFSQLEYYTAIENGEVFLRRFANVEDLEFTLPKEKSEFIWLNYLLGTIVIISLIIAYIRLQRKKRRNIDLLNNISETQVNENEVDAYTKETYELCDSYKFLDSQLKQKDARAICCNLFGEMDLEINGKIVGDFHSIKAKQLLAFLILQEHPVSKDEIIYNLWQEKDNKNSNDVFHSTLYNLRKTLKSYDDQHKYVVCVNRRYSLEENILFSTHELYNQSLDDLLNQSIMCPEYIDIIEKIIALYVGDLLYNYDFLWVQEPQKFIQLIYEKALLQLGNHYINQDEGTNVVMIIQKLINSNPYCDEAYCLLMKAYSHMNERHEIHTIYEKYVRMMKEELGCPPNGEVEEVYIQLMD